MDEELPKDNSSFVGASPLLEIMGSFPLLQTIGGLVRSPSRTSFPSSRFFLPGTVTDHSHVASIQRELVTPTSISPAPPASSPSLNANGGTDLQVFQATNCLTL